MTYKMFEQVERHKDKDNKEQFTLETIKLFFSSCYSHAKAQHSLNNVCVSCHHHHKCNYFVALNETENNNNTNNDTTNTIK